MAHCPECLTEYTENAVECMDCHVALVPGAPPTSPNRETPGVKLMRVRTFSGPTAQMDADLARNILEQEGIPSVLPGEYSSETLPGVDVVQLLVREPDAGQAAEILESFLDNPQGAAADEA